MKHGFFLGLPGDLPGLSLWLRADIGVTTNGSNVTGWSDQSPNGYILTPDFETTDITLVPSVPTLNSKPAILFQTSAEGGDVGLYINSPFEGKTVFIVYILTSVAGFEYSIIYENSGINNYTSYGGGNRKFGGYFNNFFDADTLSDLNTPYIRATVTEDGQDLKYYTNAGNDGNPTGGGFYPRTAIVVGNGNARGAVEPEPTNQPFQGYIAEIIVYNRVLAGAEISTVNNYLRNKYKI